MCVRVRVSVYIYIYLYSIYGLTLNPGNYCELLGNLLVFYSLVEQSVAPPYRHANPPPFMEEVRFWIWLHQNLETQP